MDYLRQLDIFDPEEYGCDVSIVGCGAVGSMTALIASKMGIKNFVLYDFDKIEKHNLPNQFYMTKCLGGKKNKECKKMMEMFSDKLSIITEEKVKEDTLLMTKMVVVSCDSMAARKLVFERTNPAINKYLIDARMGGEVFRLYSVDLNDKKHVEEYKKTLYSDEEAEEEKCTAKSIIYNVACLGSLICNQMKKILKKEEYDNVVVFDLKNMNFIKRRWK